MSSRIPFTWNNANFTFNANPYTWSDVALVEEVLGGAADTSNLSGAFKVLEDEKKKKQFITLLCKIEGKEYKQTKEATKRPITAKDIKLVVKEVLNIDLKIDI